MLKTTSFYKIELAAVLVTGTLKFILVDWLMWRIFYIAGISALWMAYILFSLSADKDILKYWGFKREFFKPAMVWLMPLVILSTVSSLLFSHFNHSVFYTWHIIPFLLLYPIWGIIQQYMMLGIIANNLIRIFEAKVSRYLIVVIVSVLFSLIHYPSFLLMVIAFFMEAVFMIDYLKWRNLWAIGIAHGWIATFLLSCVLERDLWTELFYRF